MFHTIVSISAPVSFVITAIILTRVTDDRQKLNRYRRKFHSNKSRRLNQPPSNHHPRIKRKKKSALVEQSPEPSRIPCSLSDLSPQMKFPESNVQIMFTSRHFWTGLAMIWSKGMSRSTGGEIWAKSSMIRIMPRTKSLSRGNGKPRFSG